MSAKVTGVTPRCLKIIDIQGTQYEFTKILGEGAFGKVLLACKMYGTNNTRKDCSYAAKFIKIGKVPTKSLRSRRTKRTEHMRTLHSVKKEIRIQKQAADIGIAPKIFAEFECEDYYIFVMEKFPSDSSLKDYELKYLRGEITKQKYDSILEKVYTAIAKLNDIDIEHNDLHKGNIIIVKDNVMIIDYGAAEIKRAVDLNEVERFKNGEFELIASI